MNIINRLNDEISIYDLFNLADPPVKYLTDKKPCQISCPFHGQDSRPSARVYPDTNSLRCFFCSQSWRPVSFWAQINNWYKDDDKLDISRAISDLCDRYNISDQTFDWQKKFYKMKAESESPAEDALEDRITLSDYYSWTISKLTQKLNDENRNRLGRAVLNMWNDFDKINLRDKSWKEDLKKWYENAKITLNDVI